MSAKKLYNKLIYNDDVHIYTLNGFVVPSVTRILSATKFKNKYVGVNKNVLGKAASFGTNVHNAIENSSAVGLTQEELHCYMNYLGQVEDNNVSSLAKESLVQFKGLYCGTYDEIGVVPHPETGVPMFSMLDTKTTAVLDRNYLAWQLSYYGMAWKYSHKLRKSFFKENKEKLAEFGITNIKQIREFEKLFAFWIPKKGNGKFVEIRKIPETELMDNLEKYYKFNAQVPQQLRIDEYLVDKVLDLGINEVPSVLQVHSNGNFLDPQDVQEDIYFDLIGHRIEWE